MPNLAVQLIQNYVTHLYKIMWHYLIPDNLPVNEKVHLHALNKLN